MIMPDGKGPSKHRAQCRNRHDGDDATAMFGSCAKPNHFFLAVCRCSGCPPSRFNPGAVLQQIIAVSLGVFRRNATDCTDAGSIVPYRFITICLSITLLLHQKFSLTPP
jgi:hypothetical protein